MESADQAIEEMCRLAAIYRNAGTTNPCKVLLAPQALEERDRNILRVIIERSDCEQVRSWRKELAAREQTARALAKDELRNLETRKPAGSVLNFRLQQKTKK